MSGGIRQCVRDVTPYLLLLMLVSTAGPWSFGFHLAELNAPEAIITCRKKSLKNSGFDDTYFGLPQCIPMDQGQFALVSSIFSVGGLLGALAAGPISSSRGRLAAMRLLTIFFIVGSAFEAAAASIAIMGIGRVLSGIGAGASLVVVPIYVSEIAPPQERGLFGVATQIAINSGLLAAQILGYYFSEGSKWRIILAVGSLAGVLNLLALFLIPESPAWMATNRNAQDGMRILQRIRGPHHDISEETAAWGITAPSTTTTESEGLLSRRSSDSSNRSKTGKTQQSIGILDVLRSSHYRPAIISVVAVMCAQQFTGINSVMMYSVAVLTPIFPTSAALLTIATSTVNFIATLACAPLADLLGRKRSLLISIAGMGISSAALALGLLGNIRILSALAVLAFVTSFAAGLGPIPFLLASELVGQEARGATQSWALAASWISTGIVAQLFPVLNAALGANGSVYFVFVGLSAVLWVFIAWYVPETRGCRDADEVWGRTRRQD